MPEAAATESYDAVVIGGGITGLAAGWALHRARPAATIAVLEAGRCVGGKIASADVAGHRVDCGPDAFLARVPGAVELAADLGLADDLVAPATGKAWVWSRGALRALPEGLVLGVPTRLGPLARSRIVSWRGIARAAMDEIRPVHLRAEDPTVAEAIGAHLGREVVERVVDPLLGGINASDCDRLSLASAAPVLAEAARTTRLMRSLRASNAASARGQIGVEASRPVFLAPSTGVTTLVERLAAALPAATVRTACPAIALHRADAGTWCVDTPAGPIRARAIVIATPAAGTAALIERASPGAAAELRSIRTSSVALTLLAFPDDVRLPAGSGMLVPRVERRLLTASSWWHQKWPHLVTPGTVLVRASAGRDGDERFTQLDDAELVTALRNDLRDMLDITAAPIDAHVARWPNGFPQYDSGHADRVDRAEALLARDAPGIAIAGASYRGIGIPACIRSAQRAATLVAEVTGS